MTGSLLSSASVLRVARRIALSSTGEIVGRAINVVMPLMLIGLHGPGLALDAFFLQMAVAFVAFGTLANALTTALVPALLPDEGPDRWDLRPMLAWLALIAFVTALSAVAWSAAERPTSHSVTVSAAVFVMGLSGLLASVVVAKLNADHRYGLPGLSWSLRLLPVAGYALIAPREPQLVLLMAGIAVADAGRLAWLWRSVGPCLGLGNGGRRLRVPAAAWYFLSASVIAGASPLIARSLATIEGAGGVSLFEAADRLYGAFASLASIGVGSVVTVYLSRLAGAAHERRGWRLILMASITWGGLWLLLAVALWWVSPALAGAIGNPLGAAFDDVRGIFLALALGLPGLIVSGVLGRRILTVGRPRDFLPATIFAVAIGAATAWALVRVVGLAGIGLGMAASQYAVCLAMGLALKRGGRDAYSGAV